MKEAEAAARISGLQLQFFEASAPNEFDAAFAAMRRAGTRALLVLSDPLVSLHDAVLADLIAKDRLIAVGGACAFVQAGGLMAYGPSYFHASKRAAAYVDKILKGAKPADLPVEQPPRFELVVNLKTAKALGITIPQTILFRANDVIE